MNWKNKKLIKASVLSRVGGICQIRTNTLIKVVGLAVMRTKTPNGYVTEFPTKKNVRYNVVGED